MIGIWRTLVLVALLAAPAHAKPKAGEGEPEITKAGKGLFGHTVYRQIFGIPPQSFAAPELTIAERFWLAGTEAPLKPMSILVSCNISLDGGVDQLGCQPKMDDSPEASVVLRLAKLRNQMPHFPRYRAIDKIVGDGWSFSRTVEFTLVSPEFVPIDVDLETGPLLEKSLFQSYIGQQARKLSYPGRALRFEVEGVQEIECQVQQDRSVICRSLSFSVAEHADLFLPHVSRLFEGKLIEPQLADGTKPEGARFRFNVNWRLPH